MYVKRLIFMLMVAGLAVVPYSFAGSVGAGQGQEWEEPVVRALAASGAKFSGVEVTAWAKVSDQLMSGTQTQAMAARVAASLGAADGADFGGAAATTTNAPYYAGSVVHIDLPDASRLQVVVQSLAGDSLVSGNRDATNLRVGVVHRHTPGSLAACIERMAAAFNIEGAKPTWSITSTGTFPGRLSQEEMESVINQVMQFLRAKRVEGITGDGIISVSGYSPALLPAVKVAGLRVNLNIAIRYHATDDATYLQIGSPLLDGEY